MTLEHPLRTIRSYVLRQGRITGSQQRALSELWSQYGLDVPESTHFYDWQKIFGRAAPCVLEIGFGMGDTLVGLAKAHPEKNFIGVEVHQPGVGHCLQEAHKAGLTNLKIFCHDAKEVLAKCIPDHSLDKILLLFPDPWPKKKHNKRRIVQDHFVSFLAQKLTTQGLFHLATDWQPYADHMIAVLDANTHYVRDEHAECNRLETKFERRGLKLGHQIVDLVYRRSSPTLI